MTYGVIFVILVYRHGNFNMKKPIGFYIYKYSNDEKKDIIYLIDGDKIALFKTKNIAIQYLQNEGLNIDDCVIDEYYGIEFNYTNTTIH